ncbi:MAG TPA: hydroxysqualene dehydroxylase HpnE, partial [Caulobacteraceae bacterium]|nr:hydroxysqualene dehydroxylase HpnE [Caulobacteraceae bacterium]
MPPSHVYVVGAGLAGLSAAVRLAGRGVAVTLLESSGQAGGRCRSFFDATLGMTIDNGNHLVLSGNHATHGYLRAIGAADRLAGPKEAAFDFCDVRSGARWSVRPNASPVGWWVFSRARRVPHTAVLDYLAIAALVAPQGGRTLGEAVKSEGALWDGLIEPLMLAALNTDPKIASAELAAAVVRETLALGGRAYAPRIADPTLEAAFVAPALAWLATKAAKVRFGTRIEAIEQVDQRVVALKTDVDTIPVGEGAAVVLATPAWITPTLLPGTPAPTEFRAIVNAHFKAARPPDAPKMVCVIGGEAQWVFGFEDRISVTVSGADAMADRPRDDIAAALWADVAKVYGLPGELPPARIVKERRATFAATPAQVALRPGARTRWRNLALAGDWTDTGLPATIEGAIRSGHKAA